MIAARAKPRARRFAALFLPSHPPQALVLAIAATLAADDLIVKYDQSRLLRLPRPASEIIIGNPAIADIAIQSGNLLVVSGKSFGITNIIALDAERNVIQDQRVLVRRDDAKVVNLQRGTERQTFNCTPQCNPSIVIGDDQKYFEMICKADRADHCRPCSLDGRTQPGHHHRPVRDAGRHLHRRPRADRKADFAHRDRRHHECRRLHPGAL
jgi:hypothetical protein